MATFWANVPILIIPATFLLAMLAELVEQVVTGKVVPVALFKRFQQVIIETASTMTLPAALAELWWGCGGSRAGSSERTASALKRHGRLALIQGQFIGPSLSAGRMHERHEPLRQVLNGFQISDVGAVLRPVVQVLLSGKALRWEVPAEIRAESAPSDERLRESCPLDQKNCPVHQSG